MARNNWTKDQLKVAFNLYCRLPFGKLDSRNAEIIALAKLIGRSPGAVAMKLVNFASLDPTITSSGRSGLGNASENDREIWDEFHGDWEQLAIESHELIKKFGGKDIAEEDEFEKALLASDYTGTSRKQFVETRVKQSFFRRAVISSYKGRCCMTGLSISQLLLASHIVPWSKDKANRLNPRNGLCLSALHDRAFDQGLITITPNFRVKISKKLGEAKSNEFAATWLLALDGFPITLPERFVPERSFLQFHNSHVFQK